MYNEHQTEDLKKSAQKFLKTLKKTQPTLQNQTKALDLLLQANPSRKIKKERQK